MKPLFELTPREIVKELDQYIIGQDSAKRSVAIALRNRWRRRQIKDEIGEEIIPNNILMIGPTGVGKTEIARRLALLAGAPFIKVEASKFTEVGYVGRDVESMVRDLVEIAVSQVRAEWMQQVEKEARNHVEERILDILLPTPKKKRSISPSSPTIISLPPSQGDEASALQHSGNPEPEDEEPVKEIGLSDHFLRTREKMRVRFRNGKFDKSFVELDIPEKASGVMQVFGPVGIEEMGVNLQEIFGNLMPSRRKRRKMKVEEAKNVLLGEEVDKLLDMDAIISEAIHRAEEMGIVFLDEIDKIASTEPSHGPDVSREGVQRDILPLIEGTRVSTKYGPVKTDHILFIAAGAFHVARPSDLIPELQGRFPIRVELDQLNKKDFIRILTEPRNSLVKQYTALLESEDVQLTFDPGAIREIAEFASLVNDQAENIGARRLHTVMNALLEDYLFRVPVKSIKQIKITKKIVQDRLKDLVENEDLSRYVL